MNSTSSRFLFLFTLGRYFNYFLQIIRGLLIAKCLGPFYFGIWGFISITLQYLSYSSIGIENGITVILSKKTHFDVEKKATLQSTSFTSITIINALLFTFALVITLLDLPLFPKFDFKSYFLFVILFTISSNIQQLLVNLHRVSNSLTKILISEGLSSILLLIPPFFLKGEILILVQLSLMIFTSIISIVIYIVNKPFVLKLIFDPEAFTEILKVTIPLFIMNVSFYFMTLSGRTFISIFYSIEEIGYFTLAYTIANATLLGFKSIAWAVYPNLLSLFSTEQNQLDIHERIRDLNSKVTDIVMLLLIMVILLLPVIFVFIPQYDSAYPTMIILLLSQGLISSSFVYNTFAIAKNQQWKIARISVVAVVLICFVSLCVSLLGLNYIFIALGIFMGSVFFTVFQTQLGNRINNSQIADKQSIAKSATLEYLLIYSLLIYSAISDKPIFWQLIGLFMFVIFAHKRLLTIIGIISRKIKTTSSR